MNLLKRMMASAEIKAMLGVLDEIALQYRENRAWPIMRSNLEKVIGQNMGQLRAAVQTNTYDVRTQVRVGGNLPGFERLGDREGFRADGAAGQQFVHLAMVVRIVILPHIAGQPLIGNDRLLPARLVLRIARRVGYRGPVPADQHAQFHEDFLAAHELAAVPPPRGLA